MVRIEYDKSLNIQDAFDDIVRQYEGARDSKYKRIIEKNKEDIKKELEEAEAKYLVCAEFNKLHTLSERENIFDLDKSTMNYFFDQKYNKSTFIPFLNYHTCPICNGPEADTIDHVLPKGRFTQYTLTPCNLVPICDRCNKRKGAYVSIIAKENPLHPYFDDINFMNFLEGKIDVNKNETKVYIGIQRNKNNSKNSHEILERERHYHNYFKVYHMYKTYNAFSVRAIHELIRTFSNFKYKLTDGIIEEQIYSEYKDLSSKNFSNINEAYIKRLVFETLYSNLSDKLISSIKNMVISR